MIGDGINDAPCQSYCRCGNGNDRHRCGDRGGRCRADGRRPVQGPEAIAFGKKALSVSNQNIVFSVAVLAILIPGALLGVLGVTLAVIFHEASELLAVGTGSGLRGGNISVIIMYWPRTASIVS